MSRKKKARVVLPPVPPVPGWIELFEKRCADAGFKVNRHPPNTFGVTSWWISVEPGIREAAQGWEESVSFFGPRDFIARAQIQNMPPRSIVDHANMVQEILATVAPELFFEPNEETTTIAAALEEGIPF